MTQSLYLILHKVRGEPAFDVAERIDQGTPGDPAPWWIIGTSGHRAYPYWSDELSTCLRDWSDISQLQPPEQLRDHYQLSERTIIPPRRTERPAATTQDLEDLLS